MLYVFFIYYTCTYIHIEIYEDMYITVGLCTHKYIAGFFKNFVLKNHFLPMQEDPSYSSD